MFFYVVGVITVVVVGLAVVGIGIGALYLRSHPEAARRLELIDPEQYADAVWEREKRKLK